MVNKCSTDINTIAIALSPRLDGMPRGSKMVVQLSFWQTESKGEAAQNIVKRAVT